VFQQSAAASRPEKTYDPILPRRSGRSVRFGFYAAGDFTFQQADLVFTTPSGTPAGGNCRCTFDEGEGFGYAGGLSLSLGFSNDRWWQTTRVSYASRTALSDYSYTTIISRPPPAEPEQEITTEEFSLNFQMINVELLFSHSIGTTGLFATGGIALGFPVTNSYEVSLTVDEVTYKPSTGKLEPMQGFTTSVVGGLGMRLKLGKSQAILQPEILYTHPLEDLSRRYHWIYRSVRAGVTLLVEL
jgi:hypothetical protein